MVTKRKTSPRRRSYRERRPRREKRAFPFKGVLVSLMVIAAAVLAAKYVDLGEISKRFLQKEPDDDLLEKARLCINDLLETYGARPEEPEFSSAGQQRRLARKSLPRATAQIPSGYSLLVVQRSLDSVLVGEGFSIGEAVLSGDRRSLEMRVLSPRLQPLLGFTIVSSPLLSLLPSNLAVIITGLESASDRLRRDFLRLDLPVTLLFDFQNRETLGLLALAKESGKEVILSVTWQEERFRSSAGWYDFGRQHLRFEDLVVHLLERFPFVKGMTFAEDSLTGEGLSNCRKVAQELTYRNGYLLALSPGLYRQLRDLNSAGRATVFGGEVSLQRQLEVSGSLRHRLLVLGDVMVHRRHGIIALEANSETLSALKSVIPDYRKRSLNLVFLSQLG